MNRRGYARCLGALLIFLAAPLLLQSQDHQGCDVRDLIRSRPPAGLTDSVFSLLRPDGSLLFHDVHRLQRTCIDRAGRLQQALRVVYGPNGSDTAVLPFTGKLVLAHVDVGSPGPPLQVDLLPAREVVCSSSDRSTWFAGIAPLAAYAGSDTSRRGTGTGTAFLYGSRIYGGIEVARGVDLLAGIEGAIDSNRLRIPLLAGIRWSPFGPDFAEESCSYLPSPCQFGQPGGPPHPGCGSCAVADSVALADNSVCLELGRRPMEQPFRPYVYAEAGIVLNGGFEGAGQTPAINESEYGQYIAGAGVGARFLGPLNVTIGYRYWRLNVRTPCNAEVRDTYVVNTNIVHSLLATIGAEF